MTSGLYDPYDLGYICATIFYTKGIRNLKVNFGLICVIYYEVGFNSNQKEERSGE